MALRAWLRVALLWVVCGTCAVAGGCARAPRPPQPVGGILDLSAALAAGRTVPLTGPWTLYWDRLLPPSDFAGPAAPAGDVPLRLRGNRSLGVLPATGFGTLRLDVALPPDPGPLAVRLPAVCSAYRLWANGVLVARAGVVGTGRATEVPFLRPALVDLPPTAAGQGVERLVLQVSNFHQGCGILDGAPVLGAQARLHWLEGAQRLLDVALVGALVAVMTYRLLIFSLWPSERSSFYFGLFCLFVLLRLLVVGSMPLAQMWPGLPFGMQVRLQYIGDYVAPLAALLLLRARFRQEVAVWALRIQGAAALVCLLSLCWSLSASAWVVPAAMLDRVGFAAYALAVLVLAAWRHREGALTLVAGLGILLLAMGHDQWIADGTQAGIHLFPVGVFALILAQSAFLARRHSGALALLRRSHRLLADHEEHVRKEIAERLHGPVQTQLLLAGQDLDEALRLLAPGGEAAPEARQHRLRALLEGARHKVDGVRERDIRQASHDLHPTVIDIGLVPAVHSLAHRHAGRLLVAVDIARGVLALDGEVPSRIPETVRLGVYRIIEEALANVQAHAAARRAEVRLSLAGATLVVQVRDDGRGLSGGQVFAGPAGSPASAGLGLRSIAARVDGLGGRWSLSPRRGGGVILEASLPLGLTPVRGGPPAPDVSSADRPAPPAHAVGLPGRRGRSPARETSR